ncbi:MAG: winged helix-turn-helix domain-containing protein, partial [Pyrinomonadaceae bacterium]
MQRLAHEIYSFGEFQLDVTRGALYRGNEELKLRPKSFDVLKYLTENQGRLVTKDEIIDAIWKGTAVTDDSLVQCLKDIRNILGDQGQSIIRTVPRRGYIFEKEVRESTPATIYCDEMRDVRIVIEQAEENDDQDAIETHLTQSGSFASAIAKQIDERMLSTFIGETASSKSDAAGISVRDRFRQYQPVIITGFATLAFAVIAFTAWQSGSSNNAAEYSPVMAAMLFQNVDVRSLTHVGNIMDSAISPDGKWIAYTTGNAGRESLSLRQVSTDSTQQIIAPTDMHYLGVSFTPDGEYVYFLRVNRADSEASTLYRVPTLGGVPERVSTDMDWCPTFSPDGKQMAFIRNSEFQNESDLMVASSDGLNERKLATRLYNEPYTYPAWSPDGTAIAASAGSVELGDSFRDVVTVNVSDGSERPLTVRKWYWISRLAWLSDGSGLIVVGNPEKSLLYSQLWMFSYPNGEVRQVT